MRRRRRTGLKISAEDARQALQVLVAEGKVAVRDVVKAVARRQKLIRELRERLAALGEEGAAIATRAYKKMRPVVRRSAKRAVKAGRKQAKRAISAATRAKYQAQGRYMAAVRSLPKAVRKRVRQVREKSGVDAAIRTALAMAKRPPVMRHTREGGGRKP